jgi:hypothetical protein
MSEVDFLKSQITQLKSESFERKADEELRLTDLQKDF